MIEIDKVCVDFPAVRGAKPMRAWTTSACVSHPVRFLALSAPAARKSTLLRTLNALQRPSEGCVKVNGVAISQMEGLTLRKARQRIGMIFQHFNLMHTRTVAQNVAFSLKAAGWERSKIAPR
jgi:D-methionine transport system ATP-binding protein